MAPGIGARGEALPAGGNLLKSEAPFVAPRNDLEQKLADLWAGLLEIEPDRIGIHENFFHLGGHSLMTTRLLSRIRDAFRLELALSTFFDDPTVNGLAQAIELARWAEQVAAEAPGAAAEEYEECEL